MDFENRQVWQWTWEAGQIEDTEIYKILWGFSEARFQLYQFSVVVKMSG